MTKCDCPPTSICACCAECPMGQADRRRQMTSMTSLTTLQRSCRHILTCQPSDESRSQLAMPSGIPCPDASSQETVQTPGTWSDVFDIHEVCATFSPITYVRYFALLLSHTYDTSPSCKCRQLSVTLAPSVRLAGRRSQHSPPEGDRLPLPKAPH